jgi:hypothetical protein
MVPFSSLLMRDECIFFAMDNLDDLADAVRKRSLPSDERWQAVMRKRSWRNRLFARSVLWFFGVAGIIGAPLHLLRALNDYRNPLPHGAHWGNELGNAIFGLLIGIGCIVYDRWRIRRERAVEEGRCAVCGYDLRATPERCPECGATARGRVVGPADDAAKAAHV